MESQVTSLTAPPIAVDLIHQLFVLFKASAIYDRNNEGYMKPAVAARRVLATIFEEEPGATIEIRGDNLFFNKYRVKFQVESYAGGRFLIDEMTRRGVGAIEIEQGVTADELDAFVFAFNRLEVRKGENIDQLQVLLEAEKVVHIKVQIHVPEEEESEEPEDDRHVTKRTFFRAVNVVEDVMSRARAGKNVNFVQAKRVVQGLVDRVIDDEQTLMELSNIHSFDEYTHAHCVNVAVYSIAIGVRLGLDRVQLSELGFGGLFHDIGKIKLPLELINKPDEYDEWDWKQMRMHPVLGSKSIMMMRRDYDRGLARAISIAFEHHIGLDGSGYPRTINKRRPDLFSRICSIADAFDAMTSGRVYSKRPMSPDEALRKLVMRAGTMYDTFLLKLFINSIGVFPIGTLVLLDTNELGVVYRNNSEDLMRPKVRVFADVDGEKELIQIMDLTRKDTHTGAYVRSIKQMIDPHKYGIDVQRYVYWKH